MELIYNTLKATKNSRKRARELLLSDLITELSDILRQNKSTRTEKVPSKARNQAKTLKGVWAKSLKLLWQW